MEITFAPKDMLQIDDVRIIYRNFEGRGDKYNHEGDRNFAVIMPDEEIANKLIAGGWNVKIKPPREEGDAPFMYLPVKVKFTSRGPAIYLVTGERHTRLFEEEVGILDHIDIMRVNLDIRPYDWEVRGEHGRTAYLQSMEVIQLTDRFSERYTD